MAEGEGKLQPTDPRPAPLVVTVAPNGARRTKLDHPALPMTAAEITHEAVKAYEAGAAMLHLHVRDAQGAHSLDADLYLEACAGVRNALGNRMVVQITTESVGRFSAAEQIACVRAVRPQAVSIAVWEICPAGADERPLASLSSFMAREKIAPQFILFDVSDVERFLDLRRRGVLAAGTVLYVLGRYARDQRSTPADLLPFLRASGGEALAWWVCAFGPTERACTMAAAALGGHARVGFENNLHLPDGRVAPDNAALVAGIATRAADLGRRLASPDEARHLLGAV